MGVFAEREEKELGSKVNMHHCSGLIFHQTTRSPRFLPDDTGHWRSTKTGGRKSVFRLF